MPFLDVSDIVLDPDFADTFSVIRRLQQVATNGVVSSTETTFANIIGVVTMSSPNDLERKEDYQFMTRSITVVCKFRLQGAVTGYQPDIILWRGQRHLVKHVSPYPHFGQGFYEAECSSMSNTEGPV